MLLDNTISLNEKLSCAFCQCRCELHMLHGGIEISSITYWKPPLVYSYNVAVNFIIDSRFEDT